MRLLPVENRQLCRFDNLLQHWHGTRYQFVQMLLRTLPAIFHGNGAW